MPSQKPRLNLTLDDDLRAVIDRLADLMGKSRAGLVNDLLKEMHPALVDLAIALEAVKNKENILPHLAKMSVYANRETAVINNEMADLYSKDTQK